MRTPFDRSFDELLNGLLTDYRNQVDADGKPIDTSKGSLAFIKSACTASALWGLYQAQGHIADQIFPDSADSANLERHVYTRGIPPRKSGESDADLLARLLSYIRRPPAGGNKYDYVKWALEVQNVKAAYAIPLAQGSGTIDVVIVADAALTGSEIPDPDLLVAVKAYFDNKRPVTAKYSRAIAVGLLPTDVTVTAEGADYNKVQTAADIAAYLAGFVPGQALYPSALSFYARQNGAENDPVVSPADPVIPDLNQIIRPGVVSVP